MIGYGEGDAGMRDGSLISATNYIDLAQEASRVGCQNDFADHSWAESREFVTELMADPRIVAKLEPDICPDFVKHVLAHWVFYQYDYKGYKSSVDEALSLIDTVVWIFDNRYYQKYPGAAHEGVSAG